MSPDYVKGWNARIEYLNEYEKMNQGSYLWPIMLMFGAILWFYPPTIIAAKIFFEGIHWQVYANPHPVLVGIVLTGLALSVGGFFLMRSERKKYEADKEAWQDKWRGRVPQSEG